MEKVRWASHCLFNPERTDSVDSLQFMCIEKMSVAQNHLQGAVTKN